MSLAFFVVVIFCLLPESLQIKCHSCIESLDGHRVPTMSFPGFPNFRIPTEPAAGFPDIPTKPCGKLEGDLIVDCPAASHACYKVIGDKMIARTCGLDKSFCEDLKGCHSCDKNGCNNASTITLGFGVIIALFTFLRIW